MLAAFLNLSKILTAHMHVLTVVLVYFVVLDFRVVSPSSCNPEQKHTKMPGKIIGFKYFVSGFEATENFIK